MAERDLGSTFLLPHTHLYKPDRVRLAPRHFPNPNRPLFIIHYNRPYFKIQFAFQGSDISGFDSL